MKRSNKIMVVISPDHELRERMIKRLLVSVGFACTPSDAGKLIRKSVHDIDLSEVFFVCASLYNFRESPITTQRLYELAARGIAVIVGVRKIPPEFEFFCSTYYPEDFARL